VLSRRVLAHASRQPTPQLIASVKRPEMREMKPAHALILLIVMVVSLHPCRGDQQTVAEDPWTEVRFVLPIPAPHSTAIVTARTSGVWPTFVIDRLRVEYGNKVVDVPVDRLRQYPKPQLRTLALSHANRPSRHPYCLQLSFAFGEQHHEKPWDFPEVEVVIRDGRIDDIFVWDTDAEPESQGKWCADETTE
jgi:hypothetical protein